VAFSPISWQEIEDDLLDENLAEPDEPEGAAAIPVVIDR